MAAHLKAVPARRAHAFCPPESNIWFVGHVYIMRHGQTTCNRDGIVQGPRIDSELSEEGHGQAQRLAQAFMHTEMDHVYVSPMLRARQTAQPIAHQGAPIEVVPELYELDFGDLCGRPLSEARPVLDELDAAWSMGFTDRPLPGGESPTIAMHRIRAMAARLREATGHIGLIAHGRINRILLTTMLGMPLTQMQRFPQDNAAITHIETGPEGAALRRLNDVSHLL